MATLCYIQQQRKLSNRRLEDHLGIRHGALARFYAGDEAYLYLVDRVEEAIEALARRRERRMAHADTKARRELAQWRSSGTWRDANEVIALIETARGGYLHQHMYFEQMMQQEPFHGSAGDDDEEAT